MGQRTAYGGQAVIEGVMIRGKDRVATAVRRKDGSITVRREDADSLAQRPWLRLAFLRGTPALIDSLRLGYRTLMWSADLAMEGEGQQKPSALHYALTIISALVIGIGVFVLLPTWLTGSLWPAAHAHAAGNGLLRQLLPAPALILPNIVEGLLRILMLVGYIVLVGRNAEIRRLFTYHGAEHKVVNAWEDGADLSMEAAARYSRIHPRCGTSFLFLFFVVGILVHALIGWPDSVLLRMASRLVLLPIVAGIAYELIRLAGRLRNSLLLRILVWPGTVLQRLTTAEPQQDQVEVALRAMRAVLEDEGVLEPEPTPAGEAAPA